MRAAASPSGSATASRHRWSLRDGTAQWSASHGDVGPVGADEDLRGADRSTVTARQERRDLVDDELIDGAVVRAGAGGISLTERIGVLPLTVISSVLEPGRPPSSVKDLSRVAASLPGAPPHDLLGGDDALTDAADGVPVHPRSAGDRRLVGRGRQERHEILKVAGGPRAGAS